MTTLLYTVIQIIIALPKLKSLLTSGAINESILQLCLVSGVCCIIAFGVWCIYLFGG